MSKRFNKNKNNIRTIIEVRGPQETLMATRAVQHAKLMIETKGGVVEIGNITGWSKSTVHRDLTNVLPKISKRLHAQVEKIMLQHQQQNAVIARKAIKR